MKSHPHLASPSGDECFKGLYNHPKEDEQTYKRIAIAPNKGNYRYLLCDLV